MRLASILIALLFLLPLNCGAKNTKNNQNVNIGVGSGAVMGKGNNVIVRNGNYVNTSGGSYTINISDPNSNTVIINGSVVNNGSTTVTASDPVVTGTIKTSTITEIETSQAIIVNYTVGSPVSVKYSVPQPLEEYLEITCVGGELNCKFRQGVNVQLNGCKVVVDVTAPKVNEFKATSSAQINVSGALNVKDLEVLASSSGTVNIPTVTASEADIEASSSGSVTISKLTSNDTELEGSSSGTINVSGSLGNVEAEASSAASIKISGSCKVLNSVASSGATVNATGAKIGTGSLKVSSGASINASQPTGSAFKTTKSSGGTISIR